MLAWNRTKLVTTSLGSCQRLLRFAGRNEAKLQCDLCVEHWKSVFQPMVFNKKSQHVWIYWEFDPNSQQIQTCWEFWLKTVCWQTDFGLTCVFDTQVTWEFGVFRYSKAPKTLAWPESGRDHFVFISSQNGDFKSKLKLVCGTNF